MIAFTVELDQFDIKVCAYGSKELLKSWVHITFEDFIAVLGHKYQMRVKQKHTMPSSAKFVHRYPLIYEMKPV